MTSLVVESSLPTTTTTTTLSCQERLHRLPRYHAKEIQLNGLLGTGAFSAVYGFTVKPQQQKSNKSNRMRLFFASSRQPSSTEPTAPSTTRTYLESTNGPGDDEDAAQHSSSDPAVDNHHGRTVSPAENVSSDSQPQQGLLLALKRLSEEAKRSVRQTKIASRELHKEARMLCLLQPHAHPHIISLYGVSNDFGQDSCSHSEFLVLERLSQTLDQTLVQWQKEERKQQQQLSSTSGNSNKRSLKHFFRNSKSTKQPQPQADTALDKAAHQHQLQSQTKRLQQAAVGLASAVAFLHDQGYIYRDLKPSNVGFDAKGQVKLFDFSTARKIGSRHAHKKHVPTKALASGVGTPRYMAPENQSTLPEEGTTSSTTTAVSLYPISYPADVYSLALLVWELCTLQKPYAAAQSGTEIAAWQQAGYTPEVQGRIASPPLQTFLQQCWKMDPSQRPTMIEMQHVLSSSLEVNSVAES